MNRWRSKCAGQKAADLSNSDNSMIGNKWTKLMLSTGEYADVHFLVGDRDAKVRVPAHKLIFKNASEVFEAMFRFDAKNERAENASANCPVVEVPNVEFPVQYNSN
ncbi:hypothetical protein niasHT_011633 [Heterodera trifolii]|uniref:BTB domain-containing protein n=1 Tax=Heterodera trifolii TaxID=157864 RepID=A0ABD2LJG2_9BILA